MNRESLGYTSGPPFSVSLRETGGVPVVGVCGEVDLATVPDLRAALPDAVARVRGACGEPRARGGGPLGDGVYRRYGAEALGIKDLAVYDDLSRASGGAVG